MVKIMTLPSQFPVLPPISPLSPAAGAALRLLGLLPEQLVETHDCAVILHKRICGGFCTFLTQYHILKIFLC